MCSSDLAVFLANFPVFAKEVLHGNEHVASLLLVVFSIGIGVGSLLCELLSRRKTTSTRCPAVIGTPPRFHRPA